MFRDCGSAKIGVGFTSPANLPLQPCNFGDVLLQGYSPSFKIIMAVICFVYMALHLGHIRRRPVLGLQQMGLYGFMKNS